MVRYYLAVFALNLFLSVLFYIKMKHSGLSVRSFVLILGVSLLSGLIFPVTTGFTNLYVALGINLIFVSFGAHFIAGREGVSDKETENQPFEAVSYLTQRYENEKSEVTEESVEEDIEEEEFVDEEVLDEEGMNEEVPDEEGMNAEVLNKGCMNEEFLDEESMDEEIAAEESMNEEVADEESIAEGIITEEHVDDKETLITDEENIEYLIDIEDEMELVAATAESEQEEYNQQGEWVMTAAQENAYDDGELRESYINRGFEAKFEGKLDRAVQFFTAALELSPPPDLELMLSLDLFSMLRELGQYDRAKDCLKKFADRNYSGLTPSETTEIKISLKYLEVLIELLAKANTPGLPYSRVPALIKVSAEEKLNNWKNEIF